MSKLECPDPPCFNVEEGVQRLREMEMLEQICHLIPTHPPLRSPENPFHHHYEKYICEGSPSIHEEFCDCLCRPDLTLELGNLNAMGVIRSLSDRGQVVALNCQKKGECGYCGG